MYYCYICTGVINEKLKQKHITPFSTPIVSQACCDTTSLRVPPNNHLEQLVGDRKGQRSIRINDQWRVCFTEKDGHFYNVEIVDYH